MNNIELARVKERLVVYGAIGDGQFNPAIEDDKLMISVKSGDKFHSLDVNEEIAWIKQTLPDVQKDLDHAYHEVTLAQENNEFREYLKIVMQRCNELDEIRKSLEKWEQVFQAALFSKRGALVSMPPTGRVKDYMNEKFVLAATRRNLPVGKTIDVATLHEIGNEIGVDNLPALKDFNRRSAAYNFLRTMASKAKYKKSRKPPE